MQALENTEEQCAKSRYNIDQFNQVKIMLHNLSYNDHGEKTLVVDIVGNVMDELRRERKTKMVLDDAEIEEYIKLDLAEAEMMDPKDMSVFLAQIFDEKKKFKLRLAQTVSIMRLGYMFKVLEMVHPGKATMLGAEAFMAKVRKTENKNNRKKNFDLKVAKSGVMASSQGGSQENIAALKKNTN